MSTANGSVGGELAADAEGIDDLGRRIRKLRKEKGIALRAMAEEAGVSVSFLSQVETGKASPSIPTLIKMARALNEHVATLFEPRSATGWLVRAGDRPQLVHTQHGWSEELLSPRDFRNLQVIQSRIAPGGKSAGEAYGYESAETCALVMEGSIRFWLDGEEIALEVGDSLAFDPSTPHRVENPGEVPATILWTSSPPAY